MSAYVCVCICMQTRMTKQISNLAVTKINRALNVTLVLLLLMDLLHKVFWEKDNQVKTHIVLWDISTHAKGNVWMNSDRGRRECFSYKSMLLGYWFRIRGKDSKIKGWDEGTEQHDSVITVSYHKRHSFPDLNISFFLQHTNYTMSMWALLLVM